VLHACPGVAAITQRQRGQLQTHGPTLGTEHQSIRCLAVKLYAGHGGHKFGGFRTAKAKICRAQLDQFAAGPHPCQRKCRIQPAAQHDVHGWRQVGQELLEALLDPPIGHALVVIQHLYRAAGM
jgi:hypothetical protein